MAEVELRLRVTGVDGRAKTMLCGRTRTVGWFLTEYARRFHEARSDLQFEWRSQRFHVGSKEALLTLQTVGVEDLDEVMIQRRYEAMPLRTGGVGGVIGAAAGGAAGGAGEEEAAAGETCW